MKFLEEQIAFLKQQMLMFTQMQQQQQNSSSKTKDEEQFREQLKRKDAAIERATKVIES